MALTAAACVIWVAALLYGEMLAFWVPPLWSCSWPTHSQSSGEDYVKIAVLTDPQLMDRTSLQLPPNSFALEMAQFYTDLYMRRAFFASILPFKPHVILFLGDYFDGGPYLSDDEWHASLRRYKHIFGLTNLERYGDILVHYLPGNHDIGYESLHSHKPEVIGRYEKEFGIRNFRFTVGRVEFIAVDAQTLDGHAEGNLTSATWDFVNNVSADAKSYPRVLLTHIPLYRPDWTHCGPQRYSPIVNQYKMGFFHVSFMFAHKLKLAHTRILRAVNGQEILYQNYITEESSKRLLDLIKPVLILSGHDHDQCTVTHGSNFGPVKEHTVGTLSWQQGNLYPSFLLLSVSNSSLLNTSSSEDAALTRLCFLPMQTHIYIWYLLLFVLTFLVLLGWQTSGMGFWHCFTTIISFHFSRRLTKEKSDNESCEYEMIWDAEGSMHLVKKPLNMPNTRSNDKGSLERGNAIMRPTARRHMSQDIEVYTNIDVNGNFGFDSATKLPARTSKSKMKIILHRLVRTFRMLAIVALVNVPLYMMLLFKDWID